ncbi:MAG: PLP-dependent aminotransferase family protein, partial [Spirochaetaceae bacterium]|nr:PLP-dependent aminotransferase family protein [Spirochaetaceae bacterium]
PRYAKRALRAIGADAHFPPISGVGATIGPSPGLIDFTALSLDERLFPVDRMRSAYASVLTGSGASLLNYAESAGYGPLREYIAARMRAHCVDARAAEIVVTHGSVQALDLAAKLFVDPGGEVVIEEPTFANAIPLFRLCGARLATLPMGAEGADLDALEAIVSRGERGGGRPSLLYSIPTFHNPTGATTCQPHRERLLALCERGGFPLVEDSFQEEITYFGKAVLPVKSMDPRGSVLYLGSFSKVLFPGIRLGWIVARADIAERLASLKRITDISCSPFAQAALLRFCESGAYDSHLRRLNRVFAARMRRAVDAFRRRLPPDKASFATPSGGYLIWIALKCARGEAEIQAALRARGVAAAPGSLFFVDPPSERYLRLSISALDEDEIEEGAARLGAAIETL